MRNFIILFLTVILAAVCFSTACIAAEVSVKLDGSEIEFIQPPVIVEGRTLVPLRAIFEALGATVEWDDATKTVTSVKDDITVKLTIGSNVLYRNGEETELDVPAQIMGIGYTMVPARAVAQAFGVTVDWDDTTKTVLLYTPKVKKTHKELSDYIMSTGHYNEEEYVLYGFWTDDSGEGHGVSLAYNEQEKEVCITYSDSRGCVFMLVFEEETGPYMFYEGDDINGYRIIYGELKEGISLSENGNEAVGIEYFTINDEDMTDSLELAELHERWIGLGCATAVLLTDGLILNETGFSICEIYNIAV